MEDVIKVKDNVVITLCDGPTGSIIHRSSHNIITHPGEFHILDMMRDRANVKAMDITNAYCAVGTGSVASDYWLGSLTTEVSGIGNPGRITLDVSSRVNQTVLTSTFFDTTEGSGTITECGLFTTGYDSGGNLQTASAAKDGGILTAYATFGAITKDATNTLTLDWEILF